MDIFFYHKMNEQNVSLIPSPPILLKPHPSKRAGSEKVNTESRTQVSSLPLTSLTENEAQKRRYLKRPGRGVSLT